MRKMTCSSCGKAFIADDNAVTAYCVHCGQLNCLPVPMHSESPRVSQQSDEPWKREFEALRFKVRNKKTGEHSDQLIGLWTLLLFHGRNSQGIFSRRRAVKDVNQFWQKNGFERVLTAAGSQAQQLLYDQLYDAARIYYQACKEDPHYGTKLFNLMKLKPDQTAGKTASEIVNFIFSYWLHMDSILHRDQIFKAAWFAFAPSFPEYQNVLSNKVQQLPEAERKEIGGIIGIDL